MPVDILVCNLTRFGDLIQTQPLFDDLHSAGLSAGLVCLQNFSSAAGMLRHVSEVWPFPASAFMAEADKSWLHASANLLAFARKVSSEAQASHVLNLTPTVPARMLAGLLAGKSAQLDGFGMDQDGYGMNTTVWASFLAASADKRSNSPFNVADLLRCAALNLTGGGKGRHELAPPDTEANKWAATLAQSLRGNNRANGLVAFQLGASEDARRWPAESFARLGQLLWDKLGLMPVLTGSPNEAAYAEEYARAAASGHPFHSAIGKTDFQQLAALLRECELLITNDTGTMHLAAGHGIPILALFLATAQAWDTAPLQPGSCCLEPAMPCHPCAYGANCGHHKCHAQIGPEAVARLVCQWRKSGSWQPCEEDENQYRLWLTERDGQGFNTVRAFGHAAKEDRSCCLSLLRDFWRQTLDRLGRPQETMPAWQSLKLSSPLPKKLPDCILPTLAQAASLFSGIYELGQIAAARPEAARLMLKNSSMLQQLLDACPALSTLGNFWRELCANRYGKLEDFLPLAQILGKACALFHEALLKNKPALA